MNFKFKHKKNNSAIIFFAAFFLVFVYLYLSPVKTVLNEMYPVNNTLFVMSFLYEPGKTR